MRKTDWRNAETNDNQRLVAGGYVCRIEDVQDNPNGSAAAIEGITSPDGRVFGKMGHAERVGRGLYRNVPGNYDLRMFEAAVQYFR